MIFHSWSWRWRPEGSSQAASGQPSSLTTLLVAPQVVFLFEAIEGTSPWSSSCCSNWGHFLSIQPPLPDFKTGVDLEIVFLAGLQSTPAWGPHWVLRQSTTCVVMMKRCSNHITDERLGCSYDMGVMTQMLVSKMTWYQDEVCRLRVRILWADHISGHISKSCD